MTKKDYIYNGVYLTILVAYYFFNVEVFNYTFKETELCDDLKETMKSIGIRNDIHYNAG